jgi:hypothetical protein
MRKEVPFLEVMDNHKNWHDDVDYINMNANHEKLKPILHKMFFEEYPKHPKIFSLIFSGEDFADSLLDGMVRLGITNLNAVWFRECSMEDADKLIDKGMIDLIPIKIGQVAMMYMKDGQDVFVNVFINEDFLKLVELFEELKKQLERLKP